MANSERIRGVESAQEVDVKQLRPDTRRLAVRARAYFRTTDGVIAAMFAVPLLALVLVKVPFSAELILAAMWLFYRSYVDPGHTDPDRKGGRKIKYNFPFRVPAMAKRFDGSMSGHRLGEGITYLGKEISSKLEVWTGNTDLRAHQLVLGTTGSGKTEFLLGLVYNALIQNSGFIYTDGKGAVDLFDNVFRLARYLGREDDLLTINFLTSGRDFLDKQKDKTTNTMNPFALGSSGMLIELIISLMDDSGASGDMWKGRAIAFVGGLTKALCFLRDRGYLLLDAGKFIEYFELPIVEKLVWDKTITENGRDIRVDDPLFDKVLAPLKAFILTLPGYKRESKGNQEQKTVEQHGFITMQLTRLFGDLGYTYGYIFQTSLGEVDMYDVVINRRILVVLLPALERAPDSLKMLGKLIVGAIKQMMAGCLGNRLEGAVREIVQARPTNAAVPFYVVLDEYGYYAVLGFAVAPAQARSLGFSITFAAQDFSSLQKASKEEADATWENTNVRIVGRITGGKEAETYKRIAAVANETQVHEATRKEHRAGAIGDGYRSILDTQVATVSRLHFDDLAQQENGEFTILVGKKTDGSVGGVRVIRARTFYTQVKERPTEIRVNHYLKIEPPRGGSDDKDLRIIEALEESFGKLLKSGKIRETFPDNVTAMSHNGKPTALLQLSSYMREARATQKLSLGEAVRVGIVCLTKQVEVEQEVLAEKVRRDAEEAAKARAVASAPGAEDAEAILADSLDVVAVAPATPEVRSESEFEIPEISMPDDFAIGATPDGLPAGEVVDQVTVAEQASPSPAQVESGGDGSGDADGDGAAGSAAVAGATKKAGDAKGSGDKSGSGSGTTATSLQLIPVETSQEATVVPRSDGPKSVGEAIRQFLEDDDFVIDPVQFPDAIDTGAAAAPDPAGAANDKPQQVSALTFRALSDEEGPTEQSMYLQNRIAEVDTLLGVKDDVLEIRNDAKEAVKGLEKATTYLEGAKPEPATFEGLDNQIKALLFAAENKSNDFS